MRAALKLPIERNLLPYKGPILSGSSNHSIPVRSVNDYPRVGDFKLEVRPLEGHVFLRRTRCIHLSYFLGGKHPVPRLNTQERLRTRKCPRISSVHVSQRSNVAGCLAKDPRRDVLDHVLSASDPDVVAGKKIAIRDGEYSRERIAGGDMKTKAVLASMAECRAKSPTQSKQVGQPPRRLDDFLPNLVAIAILGFFAVGLLAMLADLIGRHFL
jgi:hypothetical protein